jgi:hypothetical protein
MIITSPLVAVLALFGLSVLMEVVEERSGSLHDPAVGLGSEGILRILHQGV